MKGPSPAMRRVLRVAVGAVVLIVCAVLAYANRELIAEGWLTLTTAEPGWVLASVLAIAVAFFAMAEVMRLLFRAAGVRRATMASTNALTLTANAWSVSVPGGVAFATALQVRRQLQWGASAVVVSWFVVFSGALSFLGLAALAVVSLFFIGRQPAPTMLIATGVAVLALTLALWWFSRNTTLIEKLARWILGGVNRLRRRPAEQGGDALAARIAQLTEVRLTLPHLGQVFTFSLLNWLADVLCLYAAVRAIGVDGVSLTGVLLAFVTGKVAGFIQATPGGVGPVEAVLTGTLVAGGMVGSDAFAAVLLYRAVSFVLPAFVGWAVFLLGFDGVDPRTADGDADGAAAASGGGAPAAAAPAGAVDAGARDAADGDTLEAAASPDVTADQEQKR
ncbi:lysylphosphatidylglycerol synthase transmembrane domain-containing protein [Corynebacterium sp. 335C]